MMGNPPKHRYVFPFLDLDFGCYEGKHYHLPVYDWICALMYLFWRVYLKTKKRRDLTRCLTMFFISLSAVLVSTCPHVYLVLVEEAKIFFGATVQ